MNSEDIKAFVAGYIKGANKILEINPNLDSIFF